MSFTEWRSEWTRLAAREPLCLSLHTSLFFCFLFFFLILPHLDLSWVTTSKFRLPMVGGEKKSHGKEKKNNKHVTEFSLCAKFCARILHQSSLLILKTFLKVGTTFPTEMEQGRLL